LYSLLPYFAARYIAQLPVTVVLGVVYGTPIYWLTRAGNDLDGYGLYVITTVLTLHVARGLALTTSSFVTDFQVCAFLGLYVLDRIVRVFCLQAAGFAANMLSSLFLTPAGFIANIDTLWVGTRWIGPISYVRQGFEAYARIEFDGMTFTCPGYDVCPISTGQEALESFSMGGAKVSTSLGVLVALGAAFLLLAYVGLRFKSQKPVQ
jgi:hypothetical protein